MFVIHHIYRLSFRNADERIVTATDANLRMTISIFPFLDAQSSYLTQTSETKAAHLFPKAFRSHHKPLFQIHSKQSQGKK